MFRLLPLVLAHARHNKGRTLVLILCLAVALYLPLTAHFLIRGLQSSMLERGGATPLVIGDGGSRFDLVLHALYFTGDPPRSFPSGVLRELERKDAGTFLPLHILHRARGFPIVATSPAYFKFRSLDFAAGHPPLRLGDAVLGAETARRTGLAPGDFLPSDPGSPLAFGLDYPLELRITGVLSASRTPDDRAVFVGPRTAWILDGLGHGHEDLAEAAPEDLLSETGRRRVAAPSLRTHQRITPENLHTFHFHGDPDSFPLTAIIADPRDAYARARILAHFETREDGLQALRPERVVEEMMGILGQWRRFLDTHQALLLGVTLLLTAMILLLARRLRQTELETLHLLGCARGTVLRLQVLETLLLILAGLVIALVACRGTLMLSAHRPDWFF